MGEFIIMTEEKTEGCRTKGSRHCKGGKKVDRYSFVNSKDIREHLRKIEYNFSPLETAWLIYTCNRLSYEEKKAAWKELIATMKDCEIPKRPNCKEWESLHEFLKEYIQLIDKQIEEFYTDSREERNVYMYSFLYRGDCTWCEEYKTVFASYEECLEAYRKDADNLHIDLKKGETGILRYRIKKQSLEEPEHVMIIEYRGDNQIEDVILDTGLDDAGNDLVNWSFEGLWFDFPTPFSKGDVLWFPKDANHVQQNCDGPFVLEGLSTWGNNQSVIENGDITDMNGYGYFLNTNGTVYYDVVQDYMDLEYYPGSFTGNWKILLLLSKFISGEVGLEFFLCAYRHALLEAAVTDDGVGKQYLEWLVAEHEK